MSLELEIVTPEAKVYEATVDSVTLPTSSGEIGVLPGHVPLMTEIQAGEIIVQKGGSTEMLATSKGFAQCVGDRISVLAEDAIDIQSIDEDAVAKAQADAEEALKNAESMTDEEVEMLETTIQYAHIQLLLKQKKR
ncbi:ATP synthase F1 subunit epsilon [Puniceicoccaceae bacterium K14]|nr:ATP synthase F1 subunit epsilon [Puniceicoccaceae bacterium K14]